MPTRYFEDFQVGDAWSFDPWVVTDSEIVSFAEIYDPQPMHTDPEAAALGPHGGLIASGWQTALSVVTPFLKAVMKDTAALASPGFESFRWVKPVKAGDEITPTVSVLHLRRSDSKPDRGIARFRFEAANGDGDIVWEAEGIFLISIRPTG